MVSAIMEQQLLHASMDWTQLPDACRLLIARLMDSYTRAAWRTVCRLTCQDVHAATTGLTWRQHLRQHLGRIPLPLPRMSLHGPSTYTTLPASLISCVPNLHHFHCNYSKQLTSIQGIPPTLRSLQLSFCDNLDSLAPLQHCTALEQLRVEWDPARQQGLAATLLPAMSAISPHLKRLELVVFGTASGTVAEAVACSLQPLTGLQELSITLRLRHMTTALWQEVLAHAVQQMTDLRSLAFIVAAAAPTPNALLHLAPSIVHLKRLQSLDLRNNRLDSQAAEALARSLSSMPPMLTRLSMALTRVALGSVPALAPTLKAQSATLRSLDLSRMMMPDSSGLLGPQGFASLAPGLRCCSALTCIRLPTLNITAAGAAALATALSGSAPRLTSLDLYGNDLGDEGAAALAPELSRMASLVELDYQANLLGPAGAASLAPALLSIARSITSLDFADNPLQEEGILALAPALQSMSSLVNLSCNSARLGPAGARALAAALLSATSTLKTLQLCDNAMGDDGVAALAPTLSAMTILESLVCQHNDLGPRGAAVLSSALLSMARLRNLDLLYNRLGFGGLCALAQGLQARQQGKQHWVIQVRPDLVTGDGALRHVEDQQALAVITDGLTGPYSWEVKGADGMHAQLAQSETDLDSDSVTLHAPSDTAEVKVIGLTVYFWAERTER